MPAEDRVIARLPKQQGWRAISKTICEILQKYKCADGFDIASIDTARCTDWDAFLRSVMEVVPSDGGTKAYYVLRLFEGLINSETVCNQLN